MPTKKETGPQFLVGKQVISIGKPKDNEKNGVILPPIPEFRQKQEEDQNVLAT